MRKLDTLEFISRAEAKHGKLYDYSNTVYVNAVTKVDIGCVLHGIFSTNPANHISKSAGTCGCPKCTGRGLSTDEWVQRFNLVHNNKFDYSKFNYTTSFKKEIIICPVHGEFMQNTHNHSQGQQCPICSNESAWINNSYYNKVTAERNKKDWLKIPCKLYIIGLKGNDETFFKVGITSQDIYRRFRAHDLPYEIEVLKIVTTNRYNAVLTEVHIREVNEAFKYIPSIKFKGHTECYTDVALILKELDDK